MMHATALLFALGAAFVNQVSGAVILERAGPCAALELFHAAGTTEDPLGSIGRAYQTALPRAVPGATVTPVAYSTIAEYGVTVFAGARAFERALTARASECPNTKFVVSGYSKGALVVHQMNLSSAVQAKVVAVTVFGDPNRGTLAEYKIPLNNRACYFSDCNNQDVFCDRPGLSIAAHLAYATDGSVTTASNNIAGCFNA